MSPHKHAAIIGIGGVSRSGKSFLAHSLAGELRGKKTIVLSQDDFVFPETDIPLIRDHIDWESPASIDFDKFRNHIAQSGDAYDIIIAEGLFAFADPQTNQWYDRRIHITLDYEEFIKRKREDLRWGKEPEWYIRHIWDSYLKYGIPDFEETPYIRLDGNQEFDIPGIVKKLRLI